MDSLRHHHIYKLFKILQAVSPNPRENGCLHIRRTHLVVRGGRVLLHLRPPCSRAKGGDLVNHTLGGVFVEIEFEPALQISGSSLKAKPGRLRRSSPHR